jgi:Leucine-rich repeat (LRR) protein
MADITIYIHLLSGDTIEVTCDPDTDIIDLKYFLLKQSIIQQSIDDLDHLPSDSKRLALSRLHADGSFEKLDNNRTLSSYGIGNDELYLVVQPKVVKMNDEQALQAARLLELGDREGAVQLLRKVTDIIFQSRWNSNLFSILSELPYLRSVRLLFRRQLDIDLLAQHLSRCHSLQELHLSDNELGSYGAEALVPALQQLGSLHVLDLSNNHIEDAGVAELVPVLQNLRELTVLDLGHNEISDAGVTLLAPVLQNLSELTILRLSGNEIGDYGASVLAGALEPLSNLEELYLKSNEIEEEGIEELSQLLSIHPHLEIYGLVRHYSGSKRCRSCGRRISKEKNRSYRRK